MSTKQWLRTGVTLVTALTLAACGNGTESSGNGETATEGDTSTDADTEMEFEVAKEGFPIVEEPITLTMLAPGTGMAEWEDMPTLNEYNEETNVHFEYTTPPLSDFSTRFNLTIASGEYPDVLYAPGTDVLTPAMEVDLGSQGILLPLNDLIEEYAPNLNALLEEDPTIRQNITTTDGNIYSLPNIGRGDTSPWIRGPVWMNGPWMDTLGIEEPETVEEFYDMLVAFRDEDPNGNGEADEIPYTDVQMDSTRPWIITSFGIKTWGIEEQDGVVRYTPATEEYRGYLEYMHRLFDEGLLDEEVFSQADEAKKAKGENDRLGVFPDWFSFFTFGGTEEDALEFPMMPPMTSEYSDGKLFPINPGMQRGTFAITNNASPAEAAAAMRWVDTFYTPEGAFYLNKGPAGYLWDWVDEEEGTYETIYEGPDAEEYRGSITPDYGITPPGLSGVDPEGFTDVDVDGRTPFQQFLYEETQEKIVEHGEVPYPLVYLTPEEQETVSGIEVDMQTYVRNSEAQFITGQTELTDENWDNYVQTIENMGLEDYVQVYQDAYDRWVEAGE